MNVTLRNRVTGRPFTARRLTPEAEFWKENAAILARCAVRAEGFEMVFREKFAVNVWAWFADKRSQIDADGLLKLPLDALKGIAYSDDKFALPRWMDFAFDAKEPRIVLEVVYPPPALMEVSA